MKAIAKSPAERYQSADDFRAALSALPAFAETLTAPMAAAVGSAHDPRRLRRRRSINAHGAEDRDGDARSHRNGSAR